MAKGTQTRKSEPREGDALAVQIAGQTVHGMPVKFSTGSLGWYVTGKVMLDGKPAQIGASVVLIGTKPQA